MHLRSASNDKFVAGCIPNVRKKTRHDGLVNSETTHPDKRKNGRSDPHLGDSFLSRIARRCLDVPPKQKANDPYDGFEDSPKSKVEGEGEGEGKPNHQIDRDGEGVDHGFQASWRRC